MDHVSKFELRRTRFEVLYSQFDSPSPDDGDMRTYFMTEKVKCPLDHLRIGIPSVKLSYWYPAESSLYYCIWDKLIIEAKSLMPPYFGETAWFRSLYSEISLNWLEEMIDAQEIYPSVARDTVIGHTETTRRNNDTIRSRSRQFSPENIINTPPWTYGVRTTAKVIITATAPCRSVW